MALLLLPAVLLQGAGRAGAQGVNLSAFVFLDLDLDGRYSLGDRPAAGIEFRLLREGEEAARSVSNVNGFANFRASLGDPLAPIDRPGDYLFQVLPPPGWRVTTENGEQARRLELLEGSIAGGAFESLPAPIGLAPPLVLRGRAPEDAPEAGSLSLSGAGRKLAEVERSGPYSLPIEPGPHRLEGAGHALEFEAGFYPIELGGLAARGPSVRRARLLDFEDADPSGDGLNKVPNGYGGLDWSNFNAIRDSFTEGSIGYVNGTVSGSLALYSSSGHPASFSRAEPFDLISAHLTLAWPKAEGERLTVEFWRGGLLLRRDSFALSAYAPLFYLPQVRDVTEVRFSTARAWQFVLDDLRLGL